MTPKQKPERPSVREVEMFCNGCGSKDTFFLTNREIWGNTKLKQNCKKCNMFTEWKIKSEKQETH